VRPLVSLGVRHPERPTKKNGNDVEGTDGRWMLKLRRRDPVRVTAERPRVSGISCNSSLSRRILSCGTSRAPELSVRSSQHRVEHLQGPGDHIVFEARFHELLYSDDAVLVQVQLPEDSIDLFAGLAVVLDLVGAPPHQLVHRHHDFGQFAAADAAVAVHVV
jgi:hypothetical protein